MLHLSNKLVRIIACFNFTCTSVPDGVCNNHHFQKPTRSEFQVHMKEVLRTAKERLRHKTRGPRRQFAERNRRNLWTDEPEDVNTDD